MNKCIVFLYLLIIHRAYFLSAKRSMSDKTIHFIKKMYVHIILKLVKQSYSQTDSADRLCLDTHKIGPLRETHTHTHIHSQTEERSEIRCTQTVQCRRCCSHLYWRLGQKRRHQVIKKKSERKNRSEGDGESGREWEKRPVGRRIMDNLMQLCLKT